MTRNLFFLYLMEICAGVARGSYLVCIGWTTLIVVGDVAAVGQVFIVAMLTNIFGGPVTAVFVDRYNRKRLTMIAHTGIAFCLLAIGFAVDQNNSLPLPWFFITVIGVTLLRGLYQGSHDGLIHANVARTDLVHVVARFRGTHLLATAIGTVITGLVIESQSPLAGFVLAALASVLLVTAVAPIKGVIVSQNATALAGFMAGFGADFAGGLEIFRNNLLLRNLTLLAGVALPIGQLSNAILSSFIHDDLGRGSDAFGFVDAAWPIGGMVAAAILSLGLKRLSAVGMEYAFAFMVGVVTIVFAYCTSVPTLALLHAAMGFSVWMCRIVIDGRILQICTNANVGRSRVYIDVMFSFVAMIMCFSPTFVKLSSTSNYFLFWGIIVVISSLLLWFRQLGQPQSRLDPN
jgi:MFS family permease